MGPGHNVDEIDDDRVMRAASDAVIVDEPAAEAGEKVIEGSALDVEERLTDEVGYGYGV